jgi:RNase P/RNase MRP subunit p29
MKSRTLLLVAIAVCAMAGVVSAQSQTATTETVTGTVVSSGGGSLVLDTATGRQTYIVDADSTIPTDLAAGSRVTVGFHRLAGDRMHAATVAVDGKPSTPESVTTQPIDTTQPRSTTGTMTPTAPAMGPTRTISGTVVSSGDGQIVLDTSSGRRTFITDSDSTIASDVVVGSRVTTEYHSLSGGRMHAANVTTVAGTAPPMAATETRMAADLPRTASTLPLAGLIGLIALAGGIAVRVSRQYSA